MEIWIKDIDGNRVIISRYQGIITKYLNPKTYLRHNTRQLNARRMWTGLESIVGMGGVVVDIGAHVGFFGLYLHCRGVLYHAYEPEPSAFKILQQTCHFGILHKAAVGPPMKFLKVEKNLTESRLDPSGDIQVECVPWENAIIKARLTKVDIEGGEATLMAVDDKVIKRSKAWLIDVHPERYPRCQELIDRFRGMGYKVTSNVPWEYLCSM